MRDNLTKKFTSLPDANAQQNNTKNSSFVILYTKGVSLWENHEEKEESVRKDKSPAFLMIARSDYMIGFPGGGLKEDESPIQGAMQELNEELGITFLTEDRLEILSQQQFTNSSGTLCTKNCFMAELSAEELKSVPDIAATKAKHFGAETRGVITVSLEHTTPNKPRPFENFLRFPMVPSVRKDISDFLEQTNIIEPHIIRELIDKNLLPPPTQKNAPLLLDNDLN